MDIDLEQIKDIVITIARQELLPRFNHVSHNYKHDGSIVTEADLIMQDKLIQSLKKAYPDIAFLGEEMTTEEEQALLSSSRAIWCVDPIDGTSNFAAGLPYFCVSVALIISGKVVLGIIYDPVHDECFSTQNGKGAFLNDQRIDTRESGLGLHNPIAFIDFKRLTPQLARRLIQDKPFGSQRSLGSVALELCWVAIGRAHLYLHDKQQFWDYAAAQIILAEANINACRFDGQPLFDNSLSVKSTLAASDKPLFTKWYDCLTILDD